MTAHPGPAYEAAGDEELLVHNWRVARLTGLGIPGPLARVNSGHLDWHKVARLVQRGCPRGWPCASPADERTRELARRRLPPRRPRSLPGSTWKGLFPRAKEAGIRVRMITGDYAVTAAAVAGQLGIDGTVLTGAEFAAMSAEQALAKVDGIGVIARVSPEHKVRLVDVLRKKGQIVAMTGDGVNDAPAVKKADIGIAMGTGTEVTQEAAVMILTDDNFSTIVKAVELGRGLYDNLARYIRFQMGGLFGYIAAFLGASAFNIAEGIPLLPLQTLWVSFTMLSIQSVGLGYSKPAAGLMDRPPLPPSRPILTRALIIWLAFVGLLMAIGTLSVIAGRSRCTGSPSPGPWAWSRSRCSPCSSRSSPKTTGTRRSPSTPFPTRRSASRPADPSSCWSCPPSWTSSTG